MADKEDYDGNLAKLPEICRVFASTEDYKSSEIGDSLRFLLETYRGLHKKYGLNSKLGDGCADLDIAAIFVRMLSWWQTRDVVHEKEPVPEEVFNIYLLLAKFTDTSNTFRVKWVDQGGILVALAEIKSAISLSKIHDTRGTTVIYNTMCTLYNATKLHEAIHIFRENKAAECMVPYTESADLRIRTLSILTIVTILDEKRAFADMHTIHFIVQGIATEKQFHGFHTIELLDGLAMLVVNDDNKKKVIEAGVLPVFTNFLLKDSKAFAKEMVVILRIIWNMAFVDKVRQDILGTKELVDVIEKSSQDDNGEVCEAACGALWKLQGGTAKSSHTQTSVKKHIFISYQWDHQETVIKLKDRLKSEGHEVWVDVDRMSGSTLEAMASAVEEAAIVLICMSERYKQSPNCRTEGEYTFTKQKRFIPLMMQRYYKPDGWLGAILGSKLYIEFNGKESFEYAYNRLKNELKQQQIAGKELTADVVDGAMAVPPSTIDSMATWTTQRVQQWMQEQGLVESKEVLKKCDGAMLLELKAMKKEAPDFFYTYLCKDLKIDFFEVLKLTKAMQNIHE